MAFSEKLDFKTPYQNAVSNYREMTHTHTKLFCKNCSYGCSNVDPIKLGDGKCQDEANVKQCFYDFGDCCQRIIDDSECQTCLCQHYGIKFPTKEQGVASFRLENINILENKRPINPDRLEHVINEKDLIGKLT